MSGISEAIRSALPHRIPSGGCAAREFFSTPLDSYTRVRYGIPMIENMKHTETITRKNLGQVELNDRVFRIGRTFMSCPIVIRKERNDDGGWTIEDSEGDIIEGRGTGTATDIITRTIA